MTTQREETNNGDCRSTPSKGEDVWIYVMGPAKDCADSIVPSFGEISAGCGPNLGEDFAKCIWPVTLKVKMGVPDQQLVRHLRDLADLIERHPKPRPEAASRETANIIPFDRDQGTAP